MSFDESLGAARPPAKPRTRVSAAERLISAAAELFYRRGFRAVGIEEIVRKAGVTKVSLYRHFDSKDDLGAACLKRAAEADSSILEAVAARYPDDPLAEIHAIVAEAARRIAAPDYRGWAASNMAVEISEPGHPVRRLCEEAQAAVRDRLLAVIRRAGLERPEALADGLMLVLEGAAASWHCSGTKGPAAVLTETCDALIAAHRPKAESRP